MKVPGFAMLMTKSKTFPMQQFAARVKSIYNLGKSTSLVSQATKVSCVCGGGLFFNLKKKKFFFVV